MKYLNCQDVSKITGVTLRRIQQKCKNNEIPGAIKNKGSWLIPSDYIDSNEVNLINNNALPLGVTDLYKYEANYYYIDKTLLIRDIIDNLPYLSLFIKPNGFGKTLNLNMIKLFFENKGKNTSKYFKDKLIWKCGEKYTKYQGKYPVIYLSFKDLYFDSIDDFYKKFASLILQEFKRHDELKDSTTLNMFDKNIYQNFTQASIAKTNIELSLGTLSRLLYNHYNEQCIIIIDEYDTPIINALGRDYYDNVVLFIRNFLSSGLNDNTYLRAGFLSGIMEIDVGSVFSGFEYCIIDNMVSGKYNKYFGFTKEEVESILTYYHLDNKYDEIKKWYGGYSVNGIELFNPRSIIAYIANKCEPRLYSLNINNNLIDKIKEQGLIDDFKENNLIGACVDMNISNKQLNDIKYKKYNILLNYGFISASKSILQPNGTYYCDLKIPNLECKYFLDQL